MKTVIRQLAFASLISALTFAGTIEYRCQQAGWHIAGPESCQTYSRSLSGDWYRFVAPLKELEKQPNDCPNLNQTFPGNYTTPLM